MISPAILHAARRMTLEDWACVALVLLAIPLPLVILKLLVGP